MYIGKESGIIQFSLEGSNLLIDGRPYPLNVPEFTKGQVLSMEV
jgi:hypothetical protein